MEPRMTQESSHLGFRYSASLVPVHGVPGYLLAGSTHNMLIRSWTNIRSSNYVIVRFSPCSKFPLVLCLSNFCLITFETIAGKERYSVLIFGVIFHIWKLGQIQRIFWCVSFLPRLVTIKFRRSSKPVVSYLIKLKPVRARILKVRSEKTDAETGGEWN